MVVAGLLVVATWLFLEKTRYGAIMRAGIENKEMVSLLGIDIHRLFTVAFALGAYLAGHRRRAHRADPRPLAGHGRGHAGHRFRGRRARRHGQPARRHRGRPADRRRPGAWSRAYWTEASVAVIYLVMAAVLVVRPQGLFGIR